MKEKLLDLRKHGKFVFLVSNNWPFIGVKILECCIGENYRDYFDLIIFSAEKPHFMYDDINTDFLSFKTKEIVKDLNHITDDDKILINGDMKMLNEFLI